MVVCKADANTDEVVEDTGINEDVTEVLLTVEVEAMLDVIEVL